MRPSPTRPHYALNSVRLSTRLSVRLCIPHTPLTRKQETTQSSNVNERLRTSEVIGRAILRWKGQKWRSLGPKRGVPHLYSRTVPSAPQRGVKPTKFSVYPLRFAPIDGIQAFGRTSCDGRHQLFTPLHFTECGIFRIQNIQNTYTAGIYELKYLSDQFCVIIQPGESPRSNDVTMFDTINASHEPKHQIIIWTVTNWHSWTPQTLTTEFTAFSLPNRKEPIWSYFTDIAYNPCLAKPRRELQ